VTCHETSALDRLRGGGTYQNFFAYTWGSLSLSLSLLHWRRELEERSGGVGPGQVQPPNFHIWSMRPLSCAGSPIALLPLPSTFHCLSSHTHTMNPFASPPICACANGHPSLCHSPCCCQDLLQSPTLYPEVIILFLCTMWPMQLSKYCCAGAYIWNFFK